MNLPKWKKCTQCGKIRRCILWMGRFQCRACRSPWAYR